MASSYPAAFDIFVPKVDLVNRVYATDVNELQSAITAVQAALGLNPEGLQATVAARLTAIEGQLGAAASPIFPVGTDLILSGDAITISGGGMYFVRSETAGVDDSLNVINGGTAGMMIYIARKNGSGRLLVKHNGAGGNTWVAGGGDYYLDEDNDGLIAVYNAVAGKWWCITPYEMVMDKAWGVKGDIMAASGPRSGGRVPVGSDGQKLVADSAQTRGVAWADDDMAIEVILGDGVNVLTTGVKGFLEAPYNFVIESATLLADVSGSCVIDIWRDTYANFPPTVADTITASAKPTLSSARASQDSTLTGWTVAVSKGDILAFNVDSAATLKQVTLSLKGRKTAVS